MANIISQLWYWAKRKPTKLALVQDDISVTYLQLVRLVLATRNHLKEVLPSERKGVVVVSIGSPIDAFVAILAARMLGYTTFSSRRENLKAFLSLGGVKAVISSESQIKAFNSDKYKDLRCPIVVIPSRIYDPLFLSKIALDKGSFPSSLGNHICHSSGSTGEPKLIQYTEEFEEKKALRHNSTLRIIGGSKILGVNGSLSSAHGWTNHICALYAGCTIFISTRDWILNDTWSGQLTHVNIYALGVDRLMQAFQRSSFKRNDRLRCTVSGGFVGASKMHWIKNNITPNVFSGMGSTEVGWILYSRIESESDSMWLQPYPGVHLEIVDEGDGLVPYGEEGQLRVRVSPHGPDRYLTDEVMTAERFRDGFFYTGDLAVQRADGRVRLLGRIADTISYPGGKLPTGPIEAEIAEHLGRSNVFVFSRQNERLEDEVVVCLEGAKPADMEDVQWLREKFGSLSSMVVRTVDRFPALANGKIDRVGLRKSLVVDQDVNG